MGTSRTRATEQDDGRDRAARERVDTRDPSRRPRPFATAGALTLTGSGSGAVEIRATSWERAAVAPNHAPMPWPLRSRQCSTKTPAQIKANYVVLMGPQAGEAFAEPMQDAARLHLKSNEFLALFAVGSAQIDTPNKAARAPSTWSQRRGGAAKSCTSSV